jgi:hypothetical protein
MLLLRESLLYAPQSALKSRTLLFRLTEPALIDRRSTPEAMTTLKLLQDIAKYKKDNGLSQHISRLRVFELEASAERMLLDPELLRPLAELIDKSSKPT